MDSINNINKAYNLHNNTGINNTVTDIENNHLNKLSIIIVNYNAKNYLKKCLSSIFNFIPLEFIPGSFEVILVDNASQDDSVSMVKKNFPQVKIIVNSKNIGFAAANNIGIKNSLSEYIMLLNSDCEIYSNSVKSLVDFMDKNKDTGIAGPKILNSDGSVQLSCRRFPSLIDAAMHSLIGVFIPDNPFSKRYKLAEICRQEPLAVDWVSGSCMLIRRVALKDTGLMDEKYFMYVEDTDLCYQMWKKGWKVFYFPKSSVLHHVGKSSENKKINQINQSIMMQKSAAYFFLKNYKKTWKILLLPIIFLVLGLRILLTFIKNLLK